MLPGAQARVPVQDGQLFRGRLPEYYPEFSLKQYPDMEIGLTRLQSLIPQFLVPQSINLVHQVRPVDLLAHDRHPLLMHVLICRIQMSDVIISCQLYVAMKSSILGSALTMAVLSTYLDSHFSRASTWCRTTFSLNEMPALDMSPELSRGFHFGKRTIDWNMQQVRVSYVEASRLGLVKPSWR